MKRFGIILSLLLATNVYGQGTQINGSQIKDDTITGVKINHAAAIAYTKINFTGMPATIVNAENPLTFNTPLSRTSNTISLSTVPVTLGGTGLTAVSVGRVPFGGSSSQLATHTNFTFDSGNNRLFVGGTSGSSTLNVNGTANVTSDLTVGGTFTINSKLYTFPAAYGSAGSGLIDAAGNGILSWASAAASGVTLQGSYPGTPDTGGLYVSTNGIFGGNIFAGYGSADLPVAVSDNAASFINIGNLSGPDPNNFYGIKMSTGPSSGYSAGNNWTSADLEFASTSTTAFGALRGVLSRVHAIGDVSSGRGLSAEITINNSSSTATLTDIAGARIYAELVDAGTRAVTDMAAIRGEVFTDGGTNTITNSYGLYLDNAFAGSTSTTVTNAYGVKVFNTWDAATAVVNGYGFVYMHPSTGVVTNEIGLFIDNINSNGGSYAVYVGGGKSYFNGPVNMQWVQTPVGTPVADAATISPTGMIFHVTGTGTPIGTVNVPYSDFVGSITLIADDVAGFTTTTGGNIAVGSTVTQNHTLTLTFDGTSWYPNY